MKSRTQTRIGIWTAIICIPICIVSTTGSLKRELRFLESKRNLAELSQAIEMYFTEHEETMGYSHKGSNDNVSLISVLLSKRYIARFTFPIVFFGILAYFAYRRSFWPYTAFLFLIGLVIIYLVSSEEASSAESYFNLLVDLVIFLLLLQPWLGMLKGQKKKLT